MGNAASPVALKVPDGFRRNVLYSRAVEYYERIASTTKRLEMTDLLVRLFKETPPEEIDRLVHLTQGKVAPDYMGVEFGLAEKLVIRVLALATGLSDAEVTALWKEKGDLGLVAQEATQARRQRPLDSEPLTLAKVYANLDEIARAGGTGSQERKINLLKDLLNSATPVEAKYIVRTVVGKMRLGVADMTIVDALAATFATKEDRDAVERAYNVSSDLGEVARVLASEGLPGLAKIRLKLFRPIRAMLCERLETLEEIVQRLGRCGIEFKYDGLRVQAHIGRSEVRLFSRHLEDTTGQFPELVAGLRDAYRGTEGIVEGEAVPVDPNTGEFLPFQEVSRRRGRKYDVDVMMKEYPVTLFLFDCLYDGGEDLTGRPYRERRERLHERIRPNERVQLAKYIDTDDPKEAEAFFDTALQVGGEGLVAKALDSPYEAGARGYQWIKFKREYAAAMSDTVDLVAVGAFAGRGKRAGTYGALLMAAYDKDADVFRTVCKLGSGFDDATLAALPDRLAPYRVPQRPARADSKLEADAWFEPAVVLEVLGAEITLSPVHTGGQDLVRKGAGFAIRFPRFTGKWREDKGPEDATTVQEIREMYERQQKVAKKPT
jgi:DNA ligase-1